MNPNDATAWMQIGIANGMSQDMAAAENSFKTAYSINPNDPEICLNLAKAYAIKGDLAKAKETIMKCEAIDPNNAAIQALKSELP